jgi:hypothetical protein
MKFKEVFLVLSMKFKEVFLVQRMSMWILKNVLTESIFMIQEKHQGQDLLSLELTRPEREVSKILLTTYDVDLSFWL